MQNQLSKMRNRWLLFMAAGIILFLPTLILSWKVWVISSFLICLVITLLFFLAVSQHKKIVNINNEFENEMIKEGRKVTTLSPEDSWNFIKHGVAVPEGQQPIFLKESHLWQSKRKRT